VRTRFENIRYIYQHTRRHMPQHWPPC